MIIHLPNGKSALPTIKQYQSLLLSESQMLHGLFFLYSCCYTKATERSLMGHAFPVPLCSPSNSCTPVRSSGHFFRTNAGCEHRVITFTRDKCDGLIWSAGHGAEYHSRHSRGILALSEPSMSFLLRPQGSDSVVNKLEAQLVL